MRVLLVPVADRPECARALNTAFDLGKRLDASIYGCHMRPHRYSETSVSTAFAEAAWRKKSTKKAPRAARDLYERMAQQHGYDIIKRARLNPGARWDEKVGSPGILMGIVGPVADLVVVSRPAKSGGVAEMFMKAALFESKSPVLILPQAGRQKIGKRIAIGWNQSAEAARVVKSSLPLLAAADEVTIITAGPEDHPGPKSAQLAAYLTHWGVKSTRIATRGRNIEKELQGAYKDCGADMFLAGAYSRSRWREMVFGGTTNFLLQKARVPVLTQIG